MELIQPLLLGLEGFPPGFGTTKVSLMMLSWMGTGVIAEFGLLVNK